MRSPLEDDEDGRLVVEEEEESLGPLIRFRFLITSVLRERGRTTPWSFCVKKMKDEEIRRWLGMSKRERDGKAGRT